MIENIFIFQVFFFLKFYLIIEMRPNRSIFFQTMFEQMNLKSYDTSIEWDDNRD